MHYGTSGTDEKPVGHGAPEVADGGRQQTATPAGTVENAVAEQFQATVASVDIDTRANRCPENDHTTTAASGHATCTAHVAGPPFLQIKPDPAAGQPPRASVVPTETSVVSPDAADTAARGRTIAAATADIVAVGTTADTTHTVPPPGDWSHHPTGGLSPFPAAARGSAQLAEVAVIKPEPVHLPCGPADTCGKTGIATAPGGTGFTLLPHEHARGGANPKAETLDPENCGRSAFGTENVGGQEGDTWGRGPQRELGKSAALVVSPDPSEVNQNAEASPGSDPKALGPPTCDEDGFMKIAVGAGRKLGDGGTPETVRQLRRDEAKGVAQRLKECLAKENKVLAFGKVRGRGGVGGACDRRVVV